MIEDKIGRRLVCECEPKEEADNLLVACPYLRFMAWGMLKRLQAIFSEGVTTSVLTNTFMHIQGIGVKTEQTLWSSGLTQ